MIEVDLCDSFKLPQSVDITLCELILCFMKTYECDHGRTLTLTSLKNLYIQTLVHLLVVEF